jgi:hypothetical protein
MFARRHGEKSSGDDGDDEIAVINLLSTPRYQSNPSLVDLVCNYYRINRICGYI